jgi:hypothetical protein
MLLLDQFNDFFRNALLTNQTSTLNPDVEQMTEAQFDDFVNNCDMFYEPYQNWMKAEEM